MTEIQYTRCSKCKQEYPATSEYFQCNRNTKDGLIGRCKNCTNKHPVEHLDQGMRRCTKCKMVFPETEMFFRYRIHRGSFFAKCHQCEKKHDAEIRKNNQNRVSDTQKRFRLNNPERSKEIKTRWVNKNKESISKKASRKYIENRDVLSAKMKEYNVRFPEQKRARSQKRRALLKNAEGHHTAEDIRILFTEQNERCAYCGIYLFWSIPKDIHIDHVYPLSRGGTNNPDNLACTCADCNLTKGEKTVSEWENIRGW